MKICYLNGPRLLRAMLAGSESVITRSEYLNKINVFPVADNDTGTNMALTLQNIYKALNENPSASIQTVSSTLADSALMGAQGNSGVILAQFFFGFAENISDKSRIKVKTFSKAVNHALETAYTALSEPVEGTILTVMDSWAKAVESASDKTHDFAKLLKESLEAARQSLADTPKKMKLLADSGVVDAGAQGFVYLLEGIHKFIDSGSLSDIPIETQGIAVSHPKIELAPEDIKYQYCTEFFLTGTDIDRNVIKEKLRIIGDSLIVAGSTQIVKVHIHSNEPEAVFRMLEDFGELSNKKIDDMKARHVAQFEDSETELISIVTDSSCDLQDEVIKELKINVVPLRINFGTESYLDKVTMTTGEFYNMFEISDVSPTTSQPTPADFKKIYESVSKQSNQIISIHVSGGASGTLQSAQTVSRNIPDTVVTTIDSTTTSVALGLLVRYSAGLLEDGRSYDEVVRLTRKMVPNIDIVVGIKDVANLIRSGRVPLSKGIVTRLLNLKPIITFDEDGKGKPISVSLGKRGLHKKVLTLVIKRAEKYTNLRFAVVHTRAPKLAKWLADHIMESFSTDDL